MRDYWGDIHKPIVHPEVGTKERLGLALETEPPQKILRFCKRGSFGILSAKGRALPSFPPGPRLCNFLVVYFIFPLTALTARGNLAGQHALVKCYLPQVQDTLGRARSSHSPLRPRWSGGKPAYQFCADQGAAAKANEHPWLALRSAN